MTLNLASWREFTRDIKIAHSIFALPFAFSAFLVASIPVPTLKSILLIVVCMVCARSFAMGANRVLDRHYDAKNPRTAVRGIPSGRLKARDAAMWSLLCAALFIIGSFSLNPLAGYCSPVVLLILGVYPFWKRISSLTHWYLGLCLGLSPIAVEVALASRITPPTVLLGIAVTCWTAGFDILYALQDIEIDRADKLHSIPARLGIRRALWLSLMSFMFMIVCLIAAAYIAQMGPIHYIGIAIVAGILATELVLIRDVNDSGQSKWLNVAFFNLNASVSMIYFLASALDRWWYGPGV